DPAVRRTDERRATVTVYPEVSNDKMSPLFQATIEAAEEAIYNSLLMATTTTSVDASSGKTVTVEALPVRKVAALLARCTQ
ncbi:MAG: P1 family peptidase, partial [Pseudomonadota bacterium]